MCNPVIRINTYRNACNIFRDGAPPCGPAGARSFMNKTRTILQRNIKFNIIDIHTGATSIFVYGVSFIQQLQTERKQKDEVISCYSFNQFTVFI